MHRLLTDVGPSIIASAVMVLAILGGGHVLAATATSTPDDREVQSTTSCLERSLVPLRDVSVRSVTQMCLTDGEVRPRVELTDATPGSVYTIWLAFLERPAAWQDGACAGARNAWSAETTAPGRVDGAVADQDGRVLLSHPLPGLRLDANTGVEFLIVEHAPSMLTGGAAQAGQFMSWNPAWSGLMGQLTDRGRGQSRLIGCAAYWIRGGAEQTEH